MNPTAAPRLARHPAAAPGTALRTEKVQPWHRDRLAIVYVRQSTPQQVLDHRESTRLQYGLVARARDLGWAADRVVVIDDDLGKSGAHAEGRVGFQRLVSEVSLDHVGLILGVEISRLARSCKDWHQLLEICALFGTLIADSDGIYDPAQYNEIICTQLTKRDMGTIGLCWDHVADFYLLISHNHAINQQFD